MPLGERQVHRVFIELRERLGWRNRGTHHAPRIHDLRHTFVVRRIVLWRLRVWTSIKRCCRCRPTSGTRW